MDNLSLDLSLSLWMRDNSLILTAHRQACSQRTQIREFDRKVFSVSSRY